MLETDLVEKAINNKIVEFTNIVVNGDEFDSAVASVVVVVLKDLKIEMGLAGDC